MIKNLIVNLEIVLENHGPSLSTWAIMILTWSVSYYFLLYSDPGFISQNTATQEVIYYFILFYIYYHPYENGILLFIVPFMWKK